MMITMREEDLVDYLISDLIKLGNKVLLVSHSRYEADRFKRKHRDVGLTSIKSGDTVHGFGVFDILITNKEVEMSVEEYFIYKCMMKNDFEEIVIHYY